METRWLQENPQLLELIVQFNLLNPQTMHPSRAPDWLGCEWVRQASQTPRGKRRVARILRDDVSCDQEGFYEFRPMVRRFGLLSFATLQQLLTHFGAVLLGPRFARIIRSSELLQVKQSLGPDLYDFAVKRSQLHNPPIEITISPAVFTPESIQQFGWQQLAACLADEPPGFLQRLQWKLPLDWTIRTETIQPAKRDKLVSLLRKLLITEIQPEIASCFM